MIEASANPFAEAARSMARQAGAVAAGTARAGAACAVAVAILVGANFALNPVAGEKPSGIRGAAEIAAMATQNAEAARVQAAMSEYYACGLLKVTKANLTQFGAGERMDRIRAMANETIEGASRLPLPSTSIGQAASNVASMAGAIGLAGLSKVVAAAVGSPASQAWASRMQSDLDALPGKLAESSRNAGIVRDAKALIEAEQDVDASIAGIGCRI
jgi:hypothetical protein